MGSFAIQDGGHKVFGGPGLQWVHWSPFPLPCLCSPTVQQLVPFHSGHLLSPLPNSHPHSQETQRGLLQQPLQRAGLVPHHGHRHICLCSLNRDSEDSSSNPCRELAWFLTTGIVISAFALPIVLARAPVTVEPPVPDPTTTTPPSTGLDNVVAMGNTTTTTTTVISEVPAALVTVANLIMFVTIGGFFFGFDDEDIWG